ncbi:YeeE/YedE thiosulfate transporter family protein [Devosia sp.]|uniref:YeeE/YedE thiosulfate transporter family protein n=1 Tax=Devosia sp. TaxID=1871048 RepID=UPI002FCBBCC2
MLECALWATIALVALHAYPMEMPGWSNWGLLALGALLFSVGTFVNGACAFGMVGRFGNGEFEYLLGFVGIYFGVSLAEFFAIAARASPATVPEPFASPVLVALLLCSLIVLRHFAGHHRGGAFLQLTVIMAAVGVIFVAIGEAEPTWPLTAIIATAPFVPIAALVIAVCMMAGTVISGATSGRRFRLVPPTFRGMIRRIVGGAMMGGGAALVPGSNDSLLLFGLASGSLQAVAAYGILVVTIATLTAIFGSSARPWTSL